MSSLRQQLNARAIKLSNESLGKKKKNNEFIKKSGNETP